jgi:zinc protease
MKLSEPSYEILWEKIQAGDTNAFHTLVDEFKNVIAAVAYSNTGDVSGSEDVAQEAFLVAWQSRQNLREPSKLAGWLVGITRNLAKQWTKQKNRFSSGSTSDAGVEVADVSPTPDQQMSSDEEHQLVWRSLESMPEIYREVLVLYYRQSQSIAEVATALEITEDAVKQRLSRGRNLLRAEVEQTIERSLRASRPNASFTASVMLLIGSSDIASPMSNAGIASAATAVGAAAGKIALGKTALGVTGGIVGGILGAWIGVKVPQQMAPTMTERKLLEEHAPIMWRAVATFLIFSMTIVPLFTWFGKMPWGVALQLTGTALFTVSCIVTAVRMNKKVKHIRATITPEEDPNPSWLKERLGVSATTTNSKWVGRKYTSATRFMGLPLVDIQVQDPGDRSEPPRAKGWIAIGNRATGLIALGEVAIGLIAIGGRAVGLFSLGGLALGLFSIGGLALGLLAIGGGAIGHSSIGGLGVGYQSVGGVAIGIYSANGGLAIGGYMAEGGLAISNQYAVGFPAKAPHANTPEAIEQTQKSWVAQYMGTQQVRADPKKFSQRVIWASIIFSVGTILILLPLPLLMYKRRDAESV